MLPPAIEVRIEIYNDITRMVLDLLYSCGLVWKISCTYLVKVRGRKWLSELRSSVLASLLNTQEARKPAKEPTGQAPVLPGFFRHEYQQQEANHWF
jgi:hypothetical protein